MEPSREFSEWDATTSRLAVAAKAPFLFYQLPQIILNAQNLLKGYNGALYAVPWRGQLLGLLGHLSLLSDVANRKERGGILVQIVGVVSIVSTLVVLGQTAVAGTMPRAKFTMTASAVLVELVLNFLNYKNILKPEVGRLWRDTVTIAGVTVLPQVMWSTFRPYTPRSNLPEIVCGSLAVSTFVLARLGKLPSKARSMTGSVSSWTATLLFMSAAVVQLWQNYKDPGNVWGLSLYTILLGMIANALVLPRALFTRNLMWFVGSSWGTLLYGWAIVVSMYMALVISDTTFWGVSLVMIFWLGNMLWNDAVANDMNSIFTPLAELVTGKRFS